MKSKILWMLVILGGVAVMLGLLFGRTKAVKIGQIRSFSFGYTRGSMVDSRVCYELELTDEGYMASVKPLNEPEEAERTFMVEESFARELEELLTRYQVGKWNGFDEADSIVSDGNSFWLHIIMTDGTRLDATGYMSWPKNYSEVRDGIEAMFERVG